MTTQQAWKRAASVNVNLTRSPYVDSRRNDLRSTLGRLRRGYRKTQYKGRGAESSVARLALNHRLLIRRQPNGQTVFFPGDLNFLFLHGFTCTHNRFPNQVLTWGTIVRTISTMNKAAAFTTEPTETLAAHATKKPPAP